MLEEEDRGNICALRLVALHAATQLPTTAFAASHDAALSSAILGESPESRG